MKRERQRETVCDVEEVERGIGRMELLDWMYICHVSNIIQLRLVVNKPLFTTANNLPSLLLTVAIVQQYFYKQ